MEVAKEHLAPNSQTRPIKTAKKPSDPADDASQGSPSFNGDQTIEHGTDSADNIHNGDTDADREQLAIARYTHMKILHDFIGDNLRDVLDLRSRIDEGKQESLRFEDLWHLFRTGDIVYSTEKGHDQLYRVFFITGGQSLKRSRNRDEINEVSLVRDKIRYFIPPEMQEEDEEETIDKMLREEGSGIGTVTPFRVDCYIMGFDGEHCGPVTLTKKIRTYVGDREITSLPIYPLRFHPKKDELLKNMEMRGRKFLFAGMTL
jgi:hypothetical protein